MNGLYRHDEDTISHVVGLFFFGLVTAVILHNAVIIPRIEYGPFEDLDRIYWNASNWWGYASRTAFWAVWGLCLTSFLYFWVNDRLFPKWASAVSAFVIAILPIVADFSQFAHSWPQVVLSPESLTLHMPARTIKDEEYTRTFKWKDVKRIRFKEVGSGGNFSNFVHVNLVVTAEEDYHFEVPFHVKPDKTECEAAWRKAITNFAPHVDFSSR